MERAVLRARDSPIPLCAQRFHNALFAGLCLAIGATPVRAQQTPQTYCASLPATSCEVLNVEVAGAWGAPAPSQQVSLPFWGGGAGILKYCRNGQIAFAPISVLPSEYGWNFSSGSLAWNSYTGLLVGKATASSGNGSSSAGSAWSNASLCAALP